MRLNIKILPKIFFLLIVIGVVYYGYLQSKDLLQGPIINIKSPVPYSTVYNDETIVKGITKNVAFLTLNNKQIYTDKDGVFEEKLLPAEGYNIIEIKGKDRFGKEKIIIIEYIARDQTPIKNKQNG